MNDEQKDELLPWPLPIKLEMCAEGLSIHAHYEDRVSHKIFDIRGWGHFTGGGACQLNEEDAEKIQKQLGDAVCDAWNTRADKVCVSNNAENLTHEGEHVKKSDKPLHADNERELDLQKSAMMGFNIYKDANPVDNEPVTDCSPQHVPNEKAQAALAALDWIEKRYEMIEKPRGAIEHSIEAVYKIKEALNAYTTPIVTDKLHVSDEKIKAVINFLDNNGQNFEREEWECVQTIRGIIEALQASGQSGG